MLYIPETLIEDDENLPETPMGSPDGDQSTENGSLTTTAKEKELKKDELNFGSQRGTIVVEGRGKPKNIDNGEQLIIGGPTGGNGGGGNNIGPGGERHTADIDDNNGKHFYPMNVPIRVFAQEISGTIYHIVMIHSNRIVENGKMEIIVCGEQYDMPIDIVETDNGKSKGNTIFNMVLSNSLVKVKIRFADNMRHTVQTKLYYEE